MTIIVLEIRNIKKDSIWNAVLFNIFDFKYYK